MNSTWETPNWEADYWAGTLVLSPAGEPNNLRQVSLIDSYGHNVTLKSWRACVRSHGIDRSAETFWKIARP